MADDPRIVATHPEAPTDERFDAQVMLTKGLGGIREQAIPAEHMAPIIDYFREGLADEQALYKANASNVIRFPGRANPEPNKGMRSVQVDTMQVYQSGQYFERPSFLSFDAMTQMVDSTPILAAIVLTRQRQVARFTGASEDGGIGFEIRHRDKENTPSGEQKESMKLLQRFFENCGWEFNPRRRRRLRRESFGQFMAKLTRETLVKDSMPIETEFKRNRDLGIDGIYSVDGSTIRLCTEEGYEGDDEIFALQVVDGRIAHAYTRDELIYEPRNPRADVRVAGYGFSEVEMLVRVVTGFLNAMTYNIKGFDENAIPRGLLQISGQYSKADLAAFKRYWAQQVKGINNAWALPFLTSEDPAAKAEWTPFNVEFNEMYFAKWMSFLASLATAIYGSSPEEINMESFAANKSSLAGNDTEERIANSTDKGFRPLMSYFEGIFSQFVVADFSEDYLFRFVGLDPEESQAVITLKTQILTVDELRAEQGYQKHPIKEVGEAPLNPALVPIYQAKVQPPPEPEEAPTDFGGPPTAAEGMDFGDAPDAPGPGSGGARPPSADGLGKSLPPIFSVR